MPKPEIKNGGRVGPFVLLKRLGSGGNAVVWRAQWDSGATTSAVKILRDAGINSEPYKRFRDEIHALQMLGDRAGLLPLLDAYLPLSTSESELPWLEMPEATRLDKALGDAPDLTRVVEALAEITGALAALAEDGYYHRDIKPSNLYAYQGTWAVGDFGLVDYPGKEPITAKGKKLGPLYYIAPEMLRDSHTADPGPADVYSAAKTLWTLGAGWSYPLPGEHRLDTPQMLLSIWEAHPRAHYLDRLVDMATRINPQARPTMVQLSGELRAWLSTSPGAHTVDDVSDVLARINAKLQPGQRVEDDRTHWKQLSRSTLERLMEGMRLFGEVIARSGASDGVSRENPTIVDHMPRAPALGGPMTLMQEGACILTPGAGGHYPFLWTGVGLVLWSNGRLSITAAHLLSLGARWKPIVISWESATVQVGSAEEEQVCQNLLNGLTAQVGNALTRFEQTITPI